MTHPHEIPDLDELRALHRLVHHGSVTDAAVELGLSQSGLSRVLGRLRDKLGDPLLVRAGRRMEPTVRALELVEATRAPLQTLEAALRAAVPLEPARLARTFHLATADLGVLLILPALAARLATEAPRVDLAVRPLGPDVTARLHDGALDLAINVRPADGSLMSRALVRDDFVVLMRPDHPALCGPWTADRYAGRDHLLVAPSGRSGGMVDAPLEALGLSRRVAVVVPGFLGVPEILAQSDLVATVPRRLGAAFARRGPLAVRELPFPSPHFTLHALWHRRHHTDPAHRFLRERLAIPADAPD
jgi:DNA-binding transcriptional LysR family regulator